MTTGAGNDCVTASEILRSDHLAESTICGDLLIRVGAGPQAST